MDLTKLMWKLRISLAFLSLLFVFAVLFFGITDPEFRLTTLRLTPSPSRTACDRPPPLRVYMYDLDRRFNFGMMGRLGKVTLASSAVPSWPSRYSVKRQNSVEYWMTASLMHDGSGEEMEVVRVLDPDQAEAFFVPFFSSLSFNRNGRNMKDPLTERDRELQIEVLEFLRNSKYYQKSGGRDHIIPMQHPNAFRFYRNLINSSILIVDDFGRYPQNLCNLRKDVVTPYVHVVDSFLDDDPADPFESRKTLLFFRGGTLKKDGGFIRRALDKILTGKEGVVFIKSSASSEGIIASTEGMRSSKFCLHPAGDTPSSCRLFDAIASHCVPVIVSDRIELPFEDEINYRNFALFFSVEDALKPDYLLEQLRQVKKERWLEMWKALKNVSHHFEFHYPPKKDDAVNMLWRQVRHKLPAAKLAINRSQRLKIPDWWS